MTAGFSLRGLLVALGIVALGLPAAVAGLFGVFAHIDRLNTGIAAVREAQLNVADVLARQSDQEAALRRFISTGDRELRTTYRIAVTELPVHLNAVAGRLGRTGADERAAAALADARMLNRRWQAKVAEPLFSHHRPRVDDRRSTMYLARFRDDMAIVSGVLVEDYHRLLRERTAPVREATIIGYASLAVVALQILVYAFLVDRLRGELRRERRVVSLLQRALTSEIVGDERLEVAASYVSATRGAKVGGDVYDVFPLDPHRTLVVIADVSGKGVEAAVDSTFVKYSLRAFASDHDDIATIVTKFNALYARSQKAPEAFVVLFAGILDNRMGMLTYVNAGHEAAYVCRPTAIEQLAPTGPIVGIMVDATFVAATTRVTAEDVLFLSTDGLTEARDPSGAFLTAQGLETWIREADASSPQRLVDALGRRLRRYTRDRNNDDLAILAVRIKRPS